MALTITTTPATVQLAKNPVYVKFLSTSHGSLDNYRVVLRVLFEAVYESGTYTEIVETEAIPDSNGETTFDIARVLRSAMEQNIELQIPDLVTPVPYLADTLRRFKIEYLEKYGTPQVEQAATTSSAYKVLYGGVDAHYFGLFDWFANLADDFSLITYYPSGKTIARDQPEFLTYIQEASAISPHAYIVLSQYDNTGTLISTTDLYRLDDGYPDYIILDRYQCAVFPVGPEALALDADAVKYTVQVYSVPTVDVFGVGIIENGTPAAASQAYTYYVDDSTQPIMLDLLWFGGFNQPHILRCTGRKRIRLGVERLTSGRITSYNYDPRTLENLQHDRSFNQSYTYRSGSLKPDELDALQELLIENKVFEYAEDGNTYRLLVTDRNYDLLETERSPNYLEFTAERSLAPVNYQRLRSLAEGAPAELFWLLEDASGNWLMESGSGYFKLETS